MFRAKAAIVMLFGVIICVFYVGTSVGHLRLLGFSNGNAYNQRINVIDTPGDGATTRTDAVDSFYAQNKRIQRERLHRLTNTCKSLQLNSKQDVFNDIYAKTESNAYDIINNADDNTKRYTNKSRHIMDSRPAKDESAVLDGLVYSGNISTRFMWSKRYKFGICKVPKCGSSLLVQIFRYLRDGHIDFEHLTSDSRHSLHNNIDDRFGIAFENIRRRRLVLIVRDPFSRLYSAYVDKILTPLLPRVNSDILTLLDGQGMHEENITDKARVIKCERTATFQEFLDFLVHSASRGDTFNRHWAPIISLCLPCQQLTPMAVVKLESFKDDLQYVLQTAGVEMEKIDAIQKVVNEQHVESTVVSVTKTVIDNLAVYPGLYRHCTGENSIQQRLWKAFQIQGYIRADHNFPQHLDAFKYSDIQNLTEAILGAVRDDSLSTTERSSQRRQALIKAYMTISKETIFNIQHIYRADFELFNYSIVPPS